MTVREIYDAIDRIAPFQTAMDFDNVGILVGDENVEVTKTLLCLDVTPRVLREAKSIGVELIIADQIEPDSQVRILDRMDLNVTETDGSLVRYAVNSIPTFPGSFDVAIRVYPKNDLLPHRMDFALVKWA